MMKNIGLAAALLAVTTSAYAGSVSFSTEFGVNGSSTAPPTVGVLLETLSLPKFNVGLSDGFQTVAAGDVLTGVTVTAGSSITSGGDVTNLSATAADFNLSVRLFDDWMATQSAGGVAAGNFTFGSFGDTLVTDSALGVTTGNSATVGGTTGLINSILASLGSGDAGLASFVGAGDFSYQFTGEASTNINGTTGSGVAEFQQAVSTAAYGFLTVEYQFDDAPTTQLPTPPPLALIAVGLLGFTGMRRYKK